ncbi:hypothetical protein B0H13DRAFT_2303944 [Mycena leptocephala]|nr:hypothetical protein B0H13DRAFT_2303944 [Mycena leptocephala]
MLAAFAKRKPEDRMVVLTMPAPAQPMEEEILPYDPTLALGRLMFPATNTFFMLSNVTLALCDAAFATEDFLSATD